ncbi:beta-glucoside-specific PTS transporter subunit IIABC [Enterococcus hulanensis]|uniref:beta-glucoside-specific PTS transporter subunit IIABC n=1 Tax=Enterococcus hulanensis TaxID=2559929 RepID=UPI001485A9C4|nr:beta-glucoside-specific PTS transporter subunit IIABC [Enterococcus hulanensis]
MNFNELAKKIIQEVGGAKNIEQVWNCTTRLRFNLIDHSVVDDEKVQAIDGVLGTQDKKNQYQIIIGTDVAEVYKEVEKLLGDHAPQEPVKKSKKGVNPFSEVLEVISGIFTPILPAIIGAGMMKCILTVLSLAKLVTPESGVYNVFFMISDAAFYFLPFLIAVSASRKFKVNEYIGLSAAGVLLYPTLINGAAEGLAPMKFFGLSIPYLSYSSSVVPIILTIWLMSYIYHFADKHIPNVFRFILTPVLTLIVTIPIALIVLAPLGNYIGTYLSMGLDWLFSTAGPVAGFVLSCFNPLLVMTGMHFAIMPIAIQNLAITGYDNFWLPFCLISNIAQAGAIFAVFMKTKNKEQKSIAVSTGISALFGITEPGMFGVTFKLKKPFYAAMLAGGIGGLIGVLLGVKTYSFSAPNILVLPTYIAPDGNTQSLIAIIIALAVSFVLSFGFTMFLKFDPLEGTQPADKKAKSEGPVEVGDTVIGTQGISEEVASPLRGELLDIQQVPDKTFSDEIVGKGVAIEPTEGKLYAPFDGEIALVFRTKHAIAFKSLNGLELLVHIGIDTVELDGDGFTMLKEAGDPIKKGELVMEFDLAGLREAGYQTITPIVITNYAEFQEINKNSFDHPVNEDSILLQVSN